MTSTRSSRSFSLLEAVASLVIIGIIAGIAATRLLDTGAAAAAEEAIIKAHLRYAQMLSMSDDTTTWGIYFAAGSYTLYEDGSPSSRSLPNEASSTHVLDGATITSGTGTVNFDNVGSPGASDCSVVVSGTRTITVTKNTGYIP